MTVLNKYWRILATGISFFLFGLGAIFIGLIFHIVAIIPFVNRQKWARKTIHLSCRFYIRIMQLLGLLDYSINVHQTPLSSTLIIANHPTLLDAVFLFSLFEDLCCITKAKLWTNPFTAGPVRVANFIANNNADFIDIAVKKILNGENILIFPEGTRSTDGRPFVFKRGAANIAVQSACKILPVSINCEPLTLGKQDRWHQVPKRKPVFSISTLPILSIEACIDTTRPRTLQYRDLTTYLSNLYQNLNN